MKHYLFLMPLLIIKLNAAPVEETPEEKKWSNWWMQYSDNQCVQEMLESGLTNIFTYEILCKANDPYKTQCIRSIRNTYMGANAQDYERMCRNSTQETVNCINAANATKIKDLDYNLCLDSTSLTGKCITSVAHVGFTAPSVFNQLCRYVSSEKIQCIDTVNSMGIERSYQYTDLCFRADKARNKCLTTIHRYGFKKVSTFKHLCLDATLDTVECYKIVNEQGYRNSNSYKLFCQEANRNTVDCIRTAGSIDFDTPGLTTSNLCLQANDHTVPCIDTIFDLGIGKNHDSTYINLCKNPTEEMVQCYRKLHSTGMKAVLLYQILCSETPY